MKLYRPYVKVEGDWESKSVNDIKTSDEFFSDRLYLFHPLVCMSIDDYIDFQCKAELLFLEEYPHIDITTVKSEVKCKVLKFTPLQDLWNRIKTMFEYKM
jgi:hypothetical protein